MQTEQFESRAHLPRLDALDDELGCEGEQIAPEPYGQTRRRRLLPSVWLLAGVAVLGVVSALIWHNLDLQLWSSTTQLLRSFAAQPTASRSSTGISSEQVLELDALKKEISELRTAQEQMVASIASLQAGQQELQRLSSIKVTYWYSEPAALIYRIAAAQQPSPAASRKQTSITRSRSEAQGGNVGRRNEGAPLPILSPRP